MTILLLVFLTAIVSGLGFWFYSRRQINSLTETIEDKNAIINSFRGHLSPPTDDVVTNLPIRFNPEHESVVDARPEKRKQRYDNRQKKNSSEENNKKTKQQPHQNTEKNNRPKPRKPKTQQ